MKLATYLKFVILIFFLCLSSLSANAAVWGSSAHDELISSRSSNMAGGSSNGVTATSPWDDGGFDISWDIRQANGIWTYVYTVNVVEDADKVKEVSHFILEVTNDGEQFDILPGSDSPHEGPQWWDESGSNPNMPNPIYGVKFDYGGGVVTYTMVTDRAPVYGVFYAKDGRHSGTPVVAWVNALNYEDYQTNELLTEMDFIVRPDGVEGNGNGEVPAPSTIILFGSSLVLLCRFKRSA